MKKFGVILAALVILSFVGCASSGGGGSSGGASGGGAAPYSIDLSTVQAANWVRATKAIGTPTSGRRNVSPFGAQYDGVLIILPQLPTDVTTYSRVTIKCKYFNSDGEEIPQGDSQAMVVMAYDINGDLEGPEMGAGRNTPLKEFNIGGFSGQVSTDRGTRIILSQNPGGILFQCSNASVKFIEVTEVTFHN